jgi:hypothetical protein
MPHQRSSIAWAVPEGSRRAAHVVSGSSPQILANRLSPDLYDITGIVQPTALAPGRVVTAPSSSTHQPNSRTARRGPPDSNGVIRR